MSLKMFLLAGLLALPVWARPLTAEDLYQFQWIGDLQVSPDGRTVVFVRVTVDEAKTGYNTALWAVPSDGSQPAHALTEGKKDRSPRWSPDGQRLALIREGQLAVMPAEGGEPEKLTELPRPVSAPVWTPDGSELAFVCDANGDDLAGKRTESDVRVITRAHFRSNGAGFLDPSRPQHLWMVSREGGSPRQLTFGKFSISDAQFFPDGQRLLFATDRRLEDRDHDPQHCEILTVPRQGGRLQTLRTLDMAAFHLRLSPDGRQLAFHGEVPRPVRSYSQPDLWLLDLNSAQSPRNLTASYDFDMGGGVAGDNSAPAGGGSGGIVWHGPQLLDVVARQGRAVLVTVDPASGQVSELTHGDQAVQAFGRGDEGTVVVKISTPTMLNELFRLDGKPLTGLNQELFSQLDLSPPEEFNYQSFDGRSIQAWVQKPPDFQAQRRYPFILNIHGGPHAAYGFVFSHEFQLAAARGYVTLYPNPRGSTSYGQEFGNLIQYHYPGDDYKDLMAGVDALLARGYLDERKLGVTGGSGGGLLTNWTVGHTRRFAAAVSQRDIADWAGWWYNVDSTFFRPAWFKAPPFVDPADFARRSPITYVNEITTPIMFVLGEEDTRTPPENGGEQLFRALKYLKRPTVMVRFPGENHDLSRSGQPRHRIERLEHILGWFDMWLKGIGKPEYQP